MRKFTIFCFAIAILVYTVGAFFAWTGFLIDWDAYWKIVGVVGGLASIFGLLGVAINPLKNADIRSFNTETLKELAKTAQEIEDKEGKLKETNDKITSLEIKRDELEVLVKKASLVLYYKEELERAYQRLLVLLDSNKEISQTIVNIQQMETEAQSLDTEIEHNDDIRSIINTIQKAKSKHVSKRAIVNIFLDTFLPSIRL